MHTPRQSRFHKIRVSGETTCRRRHGGTSSAFSAIWRNKTHSKSSRPRASASKLRKQPAPGKWSVAEILAHLADVELVVGYRVRTILGAPGSPIQAFDQDKWARAMSYAKSDARKSLERFSAFRKANLDLLKSLSPAQWKYHGMHAERGEESIETIARLNAGHDVNHLKQVEKILSQ